MERTMSDPTLKQAVQDQFAGSAEAYVTSTVHANKPDLERMVLLANVRGDESVLDIATGGGHVALTFAPHVREVVATDLTPAMLEAAERFITGRGITNVRFEIADAEALPFEDESFDIVTCRVAAHHFQDVARFACESARMLRSGGVFVLDDTIAPEDKSLDTFINLIEKLRDPTHIRDYSVSEWHTLCCDAGLTVESVETWTKTIPFDDWCERARVDEATKEELNHLLVTAPADTQHAFGIKTEAHRVTQFELHSMLLLARKP
jgi:ubiquinone/menaquinone biosynthesis C-methylase UbiE